eukprot:CAMPEP_0185852848 /NCGR_PEP_ID=MMETSP1354-20130828/16533_1 /TAXON_ID=708628 /ORGANISM="Erythrolobus madagascarensis, Strain CCMP3276" /LENGTH=89 /DNA_ID=CAMNT_0028554195 /DNA_START=138 /DNA_END=407 /DNA_ORIENTATION=-
MELRRKSAFFCAGEDKDGVDHNDRPPNTRFLLAHGPPFEDEVHDEDEDDADPDDFCERVGSVLDVITGTSWTCFSPTAMFSFSSDTAAV